MRTARFVALVCVSAALARPALADDPPGPAALRQVVYGVFCDAVGSAPGVDCAAQPEKCVMKRGDGSPFAPDTTDGAPYWAYPAGGEWSYLSGAAEQSQRPVVGDNEADYVARLSGIASPERDEASAFVRRYALGQLEWLVKNLGPQPTDDVCGLPAQKVYDLVVKTYAAIVVDAYLHARKVFKGLNPAQYAETYYAPKNRWNRHCDAFAGKRGDPARIRYRRDVCRFWLRRAAGGQAEDVARALHALITPFDAALAQKLAKGLPKAP